MVPLEEKGFRYLEPHVQHPEDLSCRKVKAKVEKTFAFGNG